MSDGYGKAIIILKGAACDGCGREEEPVERGKGQRTFKTLVVHHMDGDRANNDPANLQVLCHSCHRSIHTGRKPIAKKDIDQRSTSRRHQPRWSTQRVTVRLSPQLIHEIDQNRRALGVHQRRQLSRNEYIQMAIREFMQPYTEARRKRQAHFKEKRSQFLWKIGEAAADPMVEDLLLKEAPDDATREKWYRMVRAERKIQERMAADFEEAMSDAHLHLKDEEAEE